MNLLENTMENPLKIFQFHVEFKLGTLPLVSLDLGIIAAKRSEAAKLIGHSVWRTRSSVSVPSHGKRNLD